MLQKLYLNDNEREINYSVFYPENYQNLPLIVYLHGAGERGKNFEHIYRHGIPKLLKEENEYNAVILLMQCPAMYVWDNITDKAKAVIDKVVLEYGIKNDRISLTGSSMGGYGTFALAMAYNNFFSGIAPVAGGGMAWRAGVLKNTPVYALHGDKDELVLSCLSEHMVERINSLGGNARLVKIENKGHNDGIDYIYKYTDVMDWLMKIRRTDFHRVEEFCEELF